MPRLLTLFVLTCSTACCLYAQSDPPAAFPAPALPSITTAWSLAEARQAAVALHRTAEMEPAALPHYSVSSHSVFGRLTAPGIARADTALAPGEGLRYLSEVVRTYEPILGAYARVQAARGGYDVEVAELSGLLLRATANLARGLAVARPAPSDTGAAAWAAGEKAVAAGLAQTVGGVLEMAGDARALSAEARRRLVLYLLRAGPDIAPVLAPGDRAALAAHLDALAGRRDLPELQDDLRRLRALF